MFFAHRYIIPGNPHAVKGTLVAVLALSLCVCVCVCVLVAVCSGAGPSSVFVAFPHYIH